MIKTCERCGDEFDGPTKQRSCSLECRPSVSKHGHSVGGSWTPEYTAWKHMKARCLNPRHPRYKDWGGRGVKICDRWLGNDGFANFIVDVGARPSADHSLDRYPDKNGNYEQGNVRWATRTEQQRNTRRAKLTADLINEFHGRIEHGESVASSGRRIGISYDYAWQLSKGLVWKEFANPSHAMRLSRLAQEQVDRDRLTR